MQRCICTLIQFLENAGSSLVAQMVKSLLAMWAAWVPSLGWSTGEGNGNPLHYSCLENPMDGEAWWATVHGVAKSRTRLSGLSKLWWAEQSWERSLCKTPYNIIQGLDWWFYPKILIWLQVSGYLNINHVCKRQEGFMLKPYLAIIVSLLALTKSHSIRSWATLLWHQRNGQRACCVS